MTQVSNNYNASPLNDTWLVDGKPGKILSDLRALRQEIGAIAAEAKQGVMYKVKSAEDLDSRLRAAADKLGMPMAAAPVSHTITHYEPIPGVDRKGNPVTHFIVHCIATVRFMSDDGSYVDFVGSGHGGGTDDKSGGKASTYAKKDATLKGLCLPNTLIPDTDDEPGHLPAPPSVNMVLEAIKSAMTGAELEEAKELAAMNGNWSSGDEALIKSEFIRRKAAIFSKNN
jgi:hypothetical protein